MPVLFSVLVIALSIGALIDAIVISENRVRYLPKVAWVILIVLVPLLGSVFWFALGRDYQRAPAPWREYTDKGAPPASAPVRPRDTRSTEQRVSRGQLGHQGAAHSIAAHGQPQPCSAPHGGHPLHERSDLPACA